MECVGGCGYPMCSEGCGGVREHIEFECAAFKEKGYKVRRVGNDSPDLWQSAEAYLELHYTIISSGICS